MIAGGRERSAAMRGSKAGASSPISSYNGNAASSKGKVDCGVEEIVVELQSALAEEMALSIHILHQEEEKAAAAASRAEVQQY